MHLKNKRALTGQNWTAKQMCCMRWYSCTLHQDFSLKVTFGSVDVMLLLQVNQSHFMADIKRKRHTGPER